MKVVSESLISIMTDLLFRTHTYRYFCQIPVFQFADIYRFEKTFVEKVAVLVYHSIEVGKVARIRENITYVSDG